MVQVNYLALLLCVVWSMIVGSLWYGPLFGKPWMKMMGMTKDSMKGVTSTMMAKLYGIQFIASFVMAFVLLHSLVFASTYQNISGVSAGLQAGFWNWLGFVGPVTLGKVLWEGKPWKLWILDSGNYLVTLMGMGVILTFFM